MEKLTYEMLLSPYPIKLSVGTLRKPKLKEIYDITFTKYYFYQFLAGLTPEQYFKELKKDSGGKETWDSLDDDTKSQITVTDLAMLDASLCRLYLELLNFFFVENVVFANGIFFCCDESLDIGKITDASELADNDDAIGEITRDIFPQVLFYIRQICCMAEEEKEEEEPVFKNEIAQRLYEKMQKADKIVSNKKNLNLTLANIISKVSNKHPTISPLNVWELTAFQLFDAFGCVQNNIAFDIQSTRVSVWGDEKNKFDISFWYENTYETKKRN